MHIDQLDTPSVTVDLDKLEANILRLQKYLDQHNIKNRPHIKTHKIPEIAHMQLRGGAVGITCQKIGEAEVMAQAGIQDIFLPYNILGLAKLERLIHVARRVNLSVTADSEVTARGLSAAFHTAGLTLSVLVECDTGIGRCGVQTPQEAADLAQTITRLPGLHFGGLMTYPNPPGFDTFMSEAKKLLAGKGIPVERISGGGTSGMGQAHTHPDLTEHRAGMYIYGDRITLSSGAVPLENNSFKVITTVVSCPTATRGILDAGSKTLSSGLMGQEGFGLILEYPGAKVYTLTEEHGHVDFSLCNKAPEIGERVTIVPNHCCEVTNLANQVYAHRKGLIEIVWPVACRGLVQ